jgi:chemotaxis protein CheX
MTAIKMALMEMFMTKAEPQAWRVEQNFQVKGDVSGIVAMAQDTTDSTLILSFEKSAILTMMSNLYGKPFTAIDGSVRQGVGELSNIIYGMLKKELNANGYDFKLAIPNVVSGDQHMILQIPDSMTLVVPFVIPNGNLYVCISVKKS